MTNEDFKKRLNENMNRNTSSNVQIDVSVHNLLNRMRNYKTLNEADEKNKFDQGIEEEKVRQYFRDLNVDIKFEPLEISDKGVFWGFTLDNEMAVVYTVTPSEANSGYDISYLDEFNPDIPENEEITKRVKTYYDIFYKYWRDNVLQK